MVAIGAAVGSLIGLTGIGSGSLLTPLLILLGRLSPATAVGTSLLFSFLTKIYGSWNFHRRHFVQMDIAGDVCLGGLPGVLGAILFVRYLDVHRPEFLNVFLSHAIGVVLVVVSVIMLLRLLPLRLPRSRSKLASCEWTPTSADRANRHGSRTQCGFNFHRQWGRADPGNGPVL